MTLAAPQFCAASERAAVASLLVGGQEALDSVRALLGPEHFRDVRLAQAYRLVLELADEGAPFDVVALNERFVPLAAEAWPAFADDATGWLADLSDAVPSAANAGYFAGRVRNLWALRHMRTVLEEALKRVSQTVQPGHELETLREIETSVADAARLVDVEVPAKPVASFAERVREEYERAERGEAGLSTGIDALDAKTGGLRAPSLVVLAAPTGHGKTSLALTILRATSRRAPCLLFSREIASWQVAKQVAVSEAKVPGHLVNVGQLDKRTKRQFLHGVEALESVNLYVDDRTDDVTLMAAHTRRLHRDVGGLGLVVVDYAQLTEASAAKQDRRDLVIGRVSRTLKLLAMDLEVPVLLLSQFNRSGVKNPGGPTKNDLKESGSLEQDADQVWILTRPEEGKRPEEVKPDEEGVAWLNVDKNRHGMTGHVKLRWIGWHQTFVEWES